MTLPIFLILNNLNVDLASVALSSAKGRVAAEELRGSVDSSVNKEGLSKLLLLQVLSKEFTISEFGPSQ
jgi:hypothetical protein